MVVSKALTAKRSQIVQASALRKLTKAEAVIYTNKKVSFALLKILLQYYFWCRKLVENRLLTNQIHLIPKRPSSK